MEQLRLFRPVGRDIVRRAGLGAALLALGALLSGCGTTGSDTRAALTSPEVPVSEASLLEGLPIQARRQGGRYKVGAPYEVKGIVYRPHVDYQYLETGQASWYGPGLHGKRTANGEIFDANLMTAAHRTLPMPSLVRVTNLKNGKSAIVRVNDRGPFSRRRILDLSQKAAEALDFKRAGVAQVKVEILAEESRQLAEGRDLDMQQIASLIGTTPAKVPAALSMPTITAAAASAPVFIQAAAFREPYNAQRARAALARFGNAQILSEGDGFFYKVRLGPVAPTQVEYVLAALRSEGYSDAMVTAH